MVADHRALRAQAENPFRFSAPIQPGELVGRDAELDRLLHLASSGTYALLDAPRRFGKTSLLNALIEQWRRRKRSLAVRVDFSEVLTVEEVAARIERAYAAAGHRQLARLLRAAGDWVTLKLGPVEIGPPRTPDGTGRVHDLLELPLEVARGSQRRALVAFDEFQDVLAVPGLDGVIRSHVQHHQEHVSYVFSGSEPSLMRELFAERARPLYSQALPVRLGRIDPSILAEHIERKFAATGEDAGSPVSLCAGAGAGHHQRTILLAWHLWERTTPDAADADTVKLAIDSALEHWGPELEATWRALPTNERRVAVALAHGLAPLRQRRAQAHRTRTLIDPLFTIWLAQRHHRPPER